MDMLQAGLAVDELLRRNTARRREEGRRSALDFYEEIDRGMAATRRLLLTLLIGIGGVSVVLTVIAVSAASSGLLVAGLAQ